MRHIRYMLGPLACLFLTACEGEQAQQSDANRSGNGASEREAFPRSDLVKATLEKPQNYGGFFAFAFSPDGRTVAGGTGVVQWGDPVRTSKSGGEVLLWDTISGDLKKTLGKHGETVDWLAFSHDGKWLVSISSKNRLVNVWQMTRGTARQTFQLNGGYSSFVKPVLSSDGQWLANVRTEQVQVGDEEPSIQGQLTVWNIQSGKAKWSLPNSAVIALASSPDAKFLAGFVKEVDWKVNDRAEVRGHIGKRALVLWEANTGDVVWESSSERFTPQVLVFLPDGQSLAGSDGNSLVFWDAQTGAAIDEMNVELDGPHRLAFAPDGQTLAIAHHIVTERVELWDVANKRLKGQVSFDFSIWEPAFSLDLHSMVCVLNHHLVIIDLTKLKTPD